MQVKGIFLNWIVVKDLKAAIKFFTEIVGLKLKTFNEEFNWAELSGPGGSILGISGENLEQNIRAGTNAVTTITIDDIQKGCEEFKKKGVKLLGDIMEVPGEVKLQTFVDLDGNVMQLVELLRSHS